MRISEISSRFELPASTIRYYIDTGILVPNKVNSQYVFTDTDAWELGIVLRLKDLTFSMDEILHFMRIIRTYSLNDDSVKDRLLAVYGNKKENLELTKEKVVMSIKAIDEEIKKLQQPSEKVQKKLGIPVYFLSQLTCPKCEGFFNISKAQICSNQIYSGQLKCECGYDARIEDGILLAQPNSFYQSEKFKMLHYQEIPAQNQDFVIFQYMDRLSEHYMATLSKSYAWVDFMIKREKKKPKIIFIPDLACHFLYKYISRPYWEDTLIIVSGFSKATIKAIKSHLESLGTNLNILFIANTIHELPIKKGTIDLWIDVISSYNFGFFHESSLHEYIDSYMSNDSHVIGITKYFDPRAKSLKNIQKIFTSNYPGNSLHKCFLETIKRFGWELIEEKQLGYVINPGDYYKYVEKDEKHHFLGYFAAHKTIPEDAGISVPDGSVSCIEEG